MPQKIKIILAGHTTEFSDYLSAVFLIKPEFDVIAQVNTSGDLLEELKQKNADIIVLAGELLTVDNTVFFKVLQSNYPALKIVVIGNVVPDATDIEELTFIHKNDELENLFEVMALGKVLKK